MFTNKTLFPKNIDARILMEKKLGSLTKPYSEVGGENECPDQKCFIHFMYLVPVIKRLLAGSPHHDGAGI